MSARVRKCVSMGNGISVLDGAHRHRNDVKMIADDGFSNAGLLQVYSNWVKIWVNWQVLQGSRFGTTPPASGSAMWSDLNTAPDGGGGWIRNLDEQIAEMNNRGIGVILTIEHEYPAFATGTTSAEGDLGYGYGPAPHHTALTHFPSDVSTSSWWGYFVGYLCLRYGYSNVSAGPPASGNPSRAWVNAIEIVNEPNYWGWPQSCAPGIVANMIRTAEAWSAYAGSRPALLAPGTADWDSTKTGWYAAQGPFVSDVLANLSGFAPRMYIGWSAHNYRDIRTDVTTRMAALCNQINASSWRWKDIWLTEGGRVVSTATTQDPVELKDQSDLFLRNYQRVNNSFPQVYLHTQHDIHDTTTNNFHSALWGAPALAADGHMIARGFQRPLATTWMSTSIPKAPAP